MLDLSFWLWVCSRLPFHETSFTNWINIRFCLKGSKKQHAAKTWGIMIPKRRKTRWGNAVSHFHSLPLFQVAGDGEAEPQPQVISVSDWTKVDWTLTDCQKANSLKEQTAVRISTAFNTQYLIVHQKFARHTRKLDQNNKKNHKTDSKVI